MKKKVKSSPVKKEKIILQEKSTIIVLALALLILLVSLYAIYSDGVLKGEEDIFSVYGD